MASAVNNLLISLPYLHNLSFLFNQELFMVARLRFTILSIRKNKSYANLKANLRKLFMAEA